MNTYYAYILTNKSGTLYVGVTNDLNRRIFEHKNMLVTGFTSDYNLDRLVYFEESNSVNDAIAREKQLKRWSRAKKLALVRSTNPEFIDLCSEMSRLHST
jgi:putative endonuclease